MKKRKLMTVLTYIGAALFSIYTLIPASNVRAEPFRLYSADDISKMDRTVRYVTPEQQRDLDRMGKTPYDYISKDEWACLGDFPRVEAFERLVGFCEGHNPNQNIFSYIVRSKTGGSPITSVRVHYNENRPNSDARIIHHWTASKEDGHTLVQNPGITDASPLNLNNHFRTYRLVATNACGRHTRLNSPLGYRLTPMLELDNGVREWRSNGIWNYTVQITTAENINRLQIGWERDIYPIDNYPSVISPGSYTFKMPDGSRIPISVTRLRFNAFAAGYERMGQEINPFGCGTHSGIYVADIDRYVEPRPRPRPTPPTTPGNLPNLTVSLYQITEGSLQYVIHNTGRAAVTAPFFVTVRSNDPRATSNQRIDYDIAPGGRWYSGWVNLVAHAYVSSFPATSAFVSVDSFSAIQESNESDNILSCSRPAVPRFSAWQCR